MFNKKGVVDMQKLIEIIIDRKSNKETINKQVDLHLKDRINRIL